MTISRASGAGIGIVAVIGTVLLLPIALRHFSFFELRRLELRGVEYQDARRLVQTLGLEPRHNIFESTRNLERRLESLPGVVSASVGRRLPGTLTILLEERQPVAFVPGSEGLIPVDADAQPLPFDPTDTGLDLPLVGGEDAGLTRTLLRVLTTDPDLYATVEGAARGRGDAVMLRLRGGQHILWRGVPSMRDIRAIGAVRRQLEPDDARLAELDARFAGAVIVRKNPA